MRCTLDPLRRALRASLLSALCLSMLAACVGPLRLATTPEPPPIARVLVVPGPTPAPTQPPQITSTTAIADCTPSAIQPESREPIVLLSRVAGCPSLVRVEWRTTILLVPVELLGLRESNLAGLPEEVR